MQILRSIFLYVLLCFILSSCTSPETLQDIELRSSSNANLEARANLKKNVGQTASKEVLKHYKVSIPETNLGLANQYIVQLEIGYLSVEEIFKIAVGDTQVRIEKTDKHGIYEGIMRLKNFDMWVRTSIYAKRSVFQSATNEHVTGGRFTAHTPYYRYTITNKAPSQQFHFVSEKDQSAVQQLEYPSQLTPLVMNKIKHIYVHNFSKILFKPIKNQDGELLNLLKKTTSAPKWSGEKLIIDLAGKSSSSLIKKELKRLKTLGAI